MKRSILRQTLATCALCIVVVLAVVLAYANNTGRVGVTNGGSGVGCNCHGSAGGTSVSISGPGVLQPGETAEYSVNVSVGGSSSGGGVNIDCSDGSLSPVSSFLQEINGELTHTTGQSVPVTFVFNFTAPNTSGTSAILYATGKGDPGFSGGNWNHANNKSVQILSLPSTPSANSASGVAQTGFTANWDASSDAANYRLDVATNSGFTSFVSGYNNRTVNGTSEAVTGLTPNTTYYYRVRAVNAAGTSGNSNVITTTTLSAPTPPAPPVATAATGITQTGFTANWGSSAGATSYRLDVATDPGFTSFVSGYNNRTVNGTNQSVTGLAINTPYYYRVRAVNAAGPSGNSNVITATTSSSPTPPAPPVALAATAITQTSFTANWNASSGATSYRLDVATDINFTSFVSGYNNRTVNGTNQSVTGLAINTPYYYRVRAVNAAGPSGNSNVITATTSSSPTPPAPPVALAATAIAQTSFTANWNASSGATSYRLDVATDISFTSFVPGYNNRTVNGTSQAVTGLSTNVMYYYQVRAVNDVGTSGNSNVIAATTTSTPPAQTNLVTNGDFEAGTAGWTFFTNGSGTFETGSPGDAGTQSAYITITGAGDNVQLYQQDIILQARTRYRIRFAAYSTSGHNLSVFLHKHTSPFTNYGLENFVANLSASWQTFTAEFTTDNFSGSVNARLRFWLAPYATAGDQYFLDDIVVEEIVLANGDFEEGTTGWTFFTNESGSFTTVAPGQSGERSARISISGVGTNVQLYQKNISLEPGTRYRLSFAAYSTSGHNLSVTLHKHIAPYTNYGLQSFVADLTTTWETFSVVFTTANFTGTVTNARLRFWLAPYATAGDLFFIDNVVIQQIEPSPANELRQPVIGVGEFFLVQNYPNPFNPSTNISFEMPADGLVVLRVFDMLGREMRTLVNEERPAGTHTEVFDAAGLPSGTYFYQLQVGDVVETKKLLLMK